MDFFVSKCSPLNYTHYLHTQKRDANKRTTDVCSSVQLVNLVIRMSAAIYCRRQVHSMGPSRRESAAADGLLLTGHSPSVLNTAKFSWHMVGHFNYCDRNPKRVTDQSRGPLRSESGMRMRWSPVGIWIGVKGLFSVRCVRPWVWDPRRKWTKGVASVISSQVKLELMQSRIHCD